jgi:hypothetical protein
MLHHRLPADVDDERHRWTERRDVREILFGSDAHIHAALQPRFANHRRQLSDFAFVRREVVGNPEEPARLGDVADELPELGVGQPRWQRGRGFGLPRGGLRGRRRAGRQHRSHCRGGENSFTNERATQQSHRAIPFTNRQRR